MAWSFRRKRLHNNLKFEFSVHSCALSFHQFDKKEAFKFYIAPLVSFVPIITNLLKKNIWESFSFLKKTMQIIFSPMLALTMPSVWQELFWWLFYTNWQLQVPKIASVVSQCRAKFKWWANWTSQKLQVSVYFFFVVYRLTHTEIGINEIV